MSLSLYMDHHVHAAITDGLRHRGIDVLTAYEDGAAALDDEHLLGKRGQTPIKPVLSQQVRAATVALRRRLAGLVEAERRDELRRVRQGRHLACRQLYRLRCRETGIFVKKTRRAAPDTALYLLLDRSVSMAGARLQVASEATLATALALEEIPGCRTAVLAFPGSTEARVIPLLDFEERVRPVAGRFRIAAQGSTPMANALWRAAYGLLRRPEPRRLLVVITDGQPDHLEATRELIQRCRRAGIEVYGLGIMLDEPVKALFGAPRAVSIADLDALPAALFGLLERGLLAAMGFGGGVFDAEEQQDREAMGIAPDVSTTGEAADNVSSQAAPVCLELMAPEPDAETSMAEESGEGAENTTVLEPEDDGAVPEAPDLVEPRGEQGALAPDMVPEPVESPQPPSAVLMRQITHLAALKQQTVPVCATMAEAKKALKALMQV